jgi:hypothetical protein
MVVGPVGSYAAGWRWTDPRESFIGGTEGGHVFFVGDETDRLLIEWNKELALVEGPSGKTTRLPIPERCDGGVSQVRVGRDAFWATCHFEGALLELRELDAAGVITSSDDVLEFLRERVSGQDGQRFYVAYPFEALDQPIGFNTVEFLGVGALSTLWVTPAGQAMVNTETGELQGLRLDRAGRRVVRSGFSATLSRKYGSTRVAARTPFDELSWTSGAVVDLDEFGGVRAFASLPILARKPSASTD